MAQYYSSNGVGRRMTEKMIQVAEYVIWRWVVLS